MASRRLLLNCQLWTLLFLMSVGQILPYLIILDATYNCTKSAEELAKISPLVPLGNVTDPDLVATNDFQKEPTNLPKEDTDEYDKRMDILTQLEDLSRHYTDTARHSLGRLNDPCEPDVHKEWLTKPLRDYYRVSDWQGKICAYTRFLDCDANTNKCACADKSIYGVDFIPANDDGNPHTLQTLDCLVEEYELCYIYVKPYTWPELNYHASISLNYNTTIKKGSYMLCSFMKDENTGEISERYQICHEPNVATLIQVPTKATYGLILIWVGWTSLATIGIL